MIYIVSLIGKILQKDLKKFNAELYLGSNELEKTGVNDNWDLELRDGLRDLISSVGLMTVSA